RRAGPARDRRGGRRVRRRRPGVDHRAGPRRGRRGRRGRTVQVWPTTALALVDNPTRALCTALRVAEAPHELPEAVAALLGAEVVDGGPGDPASHLSGDATRIKIHAGWRGAVVLARPGQP